MTLHFRVLGREGCRPCQEMMARLLHLKERYHFEMDYVDIDDESALRSQYEHRVPVLLLGDQEVCHFELDEDKLLKLLS